MSDQQRPRTDLRALLESVEAAPPTAAIEVVTHELAVMVGARAVSFLIADFSGHAVVRFGRAEPGVDTADSRGVRSRETVQLANTMYERVLRTQQVDVHGIGHGTPLILPVTDRGDAIGLLELILPRYPDAQVVADVAAAAHALSLCRDRQSAAHRPVRVGAADDTVHPPCGDPAAAAARGLHL